MRRRVRHLRHGWAAALIVLAACSGGGGGDAGTATTRPAVTADVGPDVAPDVGGGIQVGDGDASDAEIRVISEFPSFTPVATSGWGADAARVALGYRPDPDGLSFPNAAPPEVFGVDDAVALFGRDAVCVDPTSACTPTAPAQAWIDTVAAASADGICEGMVVLSLDRFQAAAQPPTAELPLDAELNDRIVRLFATQFLPDVQQVADSSRGKSLRDVLTTIQSGFAPGARGYTLGIYSDRGGHSLLPYAVRPISESQVAMYVYDPNWPGLDRYIEFDLDRETWRYALESADPAADPNPWFGTGETLDLVPLEIREAPFDEPFPGAGNGEGRTLLTVTTTSPDWGVTTDGITVRAKDAVPGKNSVVAVSRGANGSGGTTVIIEVSEGAVIDAGSGSLDLTLQNDRGAVRVESGTSGSRFVLLTDDGPGVRQERGESELRAYAPGGVVDIDGGVGAEVSIDEGGRVEFETDRGRTGALDLPEGGRRDYRVGTDGSVARVPLDGSVPAPVTTSTTSTTAPPPNPNAVDVIVNFGATAPGVVFLEVNATTNTTVDFYVQVSGPGWNSTDGPTRNYSRVLQGLAVNGTYTVKVNFVDNTQTIRYFTVPGT